MSSTAKWNSSSSPSSSSALANPVKGKAVLPPNAVKKRVPLDNITNHRVPIGEIAVDKKGSRTSDLSSSLVHSSTTICQSKKAPNAASIRSANSSNLPDKSNAEPSNIIPHGTTSSANSEICGTYDAVSGTTRVSASQASMDVSPRSDQVSIYMDDSVSTSDSFKSPEVEYMDNSDDIGFHSPTMKCPTSLSTSEHEDLGYTDDEIINIDSDYSDPRFSATYACDIYKHLRSSEIMKRPSLDFMERIQKDINANMRAILIDWLVEVAEEYRLLPETLYLTVNYIDRYLSGNVINRQQLQLLGVACMMIAAKYEEICPPQVEDFCYITDNTYFKDEVLEMEFSVLNFLKFEVTAPTAKCFLRRFLSAACGSNEVTSMKLDCLASYLAELSLLDYNMLRYVPSLIAASAIFLAQYILDPCTKPWSLTLEHYSMYKRKDMKECVHDLLGMCRDAHSSSALPAVRKKYSQHKYKFVAKKYCGASVLPELFFIE